MHATLASLKDKKRYLEDQIKSYHVYIDQSMAGIQKKSKKRIVLPWSVQGVHQRQLEKQGKKYKFGSYKYTAQTLYERGVLLSIEQVSPKTFDKVSMTFSSDNVGVFEIKVELIGKILTGVELKLEDLLEAQWVRWLSAITCGVLELTLSMCAGRQADRLYRRGRQDEPHRAARPHQPQVSCRNHAFSLAMTLTSRARRFYQ
jgi:Ras GTPase-activating-like protein IQGAP2/3